MNNWREKNTTETSVGTYQVSKYDTSVGRFGAFYQAKARLKDRDTDVIFREVFRGGYYSSISFAQWLSHLPSKPVQAHFNFSDDTMKPMSK